MSADEITMLLKARGCTVVEDAGRFALVYPHGYARRHKAHDLAAKDHASASIEAWLWLHPEMISPKAIEAVISVQIIVAGDFGFKATELLEKDRSEPLATARRIAMTLARELSGATFDYLSEAFDREPGAVIQALQSVRNQCETDAAFDARVGTLRAACRSAMKS